MNIPVSGVRRKRSSTEVAALVGVGLLAGGVATVAKMKAEQFLQPLAERIWPPSPADKLKGGADPADHPENMPPTEIASAVQDRVAALPDDDDTTATAAAGLHWSMGLGSALAYTVLSDRYPMLRRGLGAPAGLVLYAVTHASTLPAAGLQPAPWRMPRAAVAWEAGSHAIYGAVLESCLRICDRFPGRR